MADKARKTTGEILTENQQLVYKAGQLQYLIRQTQKDLDMINDRLLALNVEYVGAKEFEDQLAEKMAAEKAKEAKAKADAEAVKTTQTEQPSPTLVEVGSKEES